MQIKLNSEKRKKICRKFIFKKVVDILSTEARQIVETVVEETLILSAENDYIAARMSWFNQLPRSFSWNASQALEKTLKACLILNAECGTFNHPNEKHFQKVADLWPALWPEELSAPYFFPSIIAPKGQFYNEPIANVLKRFVNNGSTNGRYRETKLEINLFDLHKFDQVFFMLHRICNNLNALGTNVIDELSLREDCSTRHFKTSELRPHLKRHVYEDNFSFYMRDYDPKPNLGRFGDIEGTFLFTRVLDPKSATYIEAAEFLREFSKIKISA